MKQLFTKCALALAMFLGAAASLQAQQAFYVYRNDGGFNAFLSEDVDSIVCSNVDVDGKVCAEFVTQEVWTGDSVCRIPLAAIDSVSFDVNRIVVSEDYQLLELDSYTVQEADTAAGLYTLLFSGKVPRLKKGHIITVANDTLARLVRVTRVDTEGNAVRIESEEASLDDVFLQGTFTLSTEQPPVDVQDKQRRGGTVFYPVSVTYCDDDGVVHRVARKTQADHELRLFNHLIDESGSDLWKNDCARLYWETFKIEFGLDLVTTCSFKNRKEAWDQFWKGNLAIYKATLRGTLDTDFMLRFDASGEKSETFPEEILKKNIHDPITVWFLVNGVFVPVTMNTHLLGHGNYSAQGNFSAYAGYATNTKAEMGLSWSKASGLQPVASFVSTYEMHNPTMEGEVHLAEKIGFFPRITFSLYRAIGLTFDIKPYVRQTLDFGFHDKAGTDAGDFYGGKYNLYGGYDGAVGLTFFSGSRFEESLMSPSWNVIEAYLYEAPKSVKFKEASMEKIRYGSPVDVTFKVSDYIPKYQMECKAGLPFVVKFETNSGILDNPFVTVSLETGEVSVRWTPEKTGEAPYLVAMMHDDQGRAIAADRWAPEVEDSTCHLDFTIEYPKFDSSTHNEVRCSVASQPIVGDGYTQDDVIEYEAVLYKDGKEVPLNENYDYKGRACLMKKFNREELLIDQKNYSAVPREGLWQVSMKIKKIDECGDTITIYSDIIKDVNMEYNTRPVAYIFLCTVFPCSADHGNPDCHEHQFFFSLWHLIRGSFWIEKTVPFDYMPSNEVYDGICYEEWSADDYSAGIESGAHYTDNNRPHSIVMFCEDCSGMKYESIVPIQTDANGCVMGSYFDNTSKVIDEYGSIWTGIRWNF